MTTTFGSLSMVIFFEQHCRERHFVQNWRTGGSEWHVMVRKKNRAGERQGGRESTCK